MESKNIISNRIETKSNNTSKDTLRASKTGFSLCFLEGESHIKEDGKHEERRILNPNYSNDEAKENEK